MPCTHTWLDMENCVSHHDSLWVGSPQHHQETFFSREDFLEQPRKSYELLEPGWAQTIRYIVVHMLSTSPYDSQLSTEHTFSWSSRNPPLEQVSLAELSTVYSLGLHVSTVREGI